MEELEKIADQLIAESSAKTLAAEQKLQLRAALIQQLNQKVGTAILGALSEEHAKQYIELMTKQAGPIEIESFFNTALPNIQQVVEAAVESYVADYFKAQTDVR